MPRCNCLCGKDTRGGSFLPGHDQKLRTRLEAQVGGLTELRDLIDVLDEFVAGKRTQESMATVVREKLTRGIASHATQNLSR